MSVVQGAMKRFALFALAAALALTLVPVVPGGAAYAATSGDLTGLSNDDIGASYTATDDGSKASWSASSNSITGSVISKKGDCSSTAYETTLTIVNNKSVAATLSFDYTIAQNSGTIQVAGTAVTTNGSYSSELAAGGSIKICLKSGSTSAPTSISVTNLNLLVDREATTTFQPAENGSYTVDGKAITAETTKTKRSTEAYMLVATPASGYKFMGWYSVTESKYISSDASATLNFDSDQAITAMFTEESNPVFEVSGAKFTDLNEANTYAAKNNLSKIMLVSDGTLPSGSYTVSSGVTLLIPFDAAGTCYTTAPANTANVRTAPSVYRKLTMAEGASITVNGAISVSAKHYAYGQTGAGAPDGKYGYIYMNDGSGITVNNGGALYVYGFVSGNGTVTAKSGATVYENMQINDFRGGTATSSMNSNAQKIFPLNQYFIQNIEAKLILESGADEYIYTSIYAGITATSTAVHFIGNSGAMFSVSEGGYFTKQYLPDKDRLEINVNGDAKINNLTLTVMGISISSGNYVLPITNCMTLNVNSGTTQVTQDVALLAGVQMSIANGATLQVTSGSSLYVYDADEWTKANYASNAKFKTVLYSPTRTYTRKASDLVDARIDVNGTLQADGYVYTTAGGADITSSEGTGQLVMNGGAGTETATYMYKDYTTTYDTIPITSAKLHNGSQYVGTEEAYTLTDGAAAGSTYYWDTEDGKWKLEGEAETITVTFDANEGKGTMEARTIESGVDTELNANTFTREGYTFTGWNTKADGSGTPYENGATVNLTEDTTFYAQWKANTYTVTWVDEDGTELEKDENVAYGTTPEYNGETPTKESDAQYSYTFKGWTPEVSAATADITYKAVYEQTVNQYTITWKNWDGTELKTEQVAYGEVPAYTGETPTREGDAEHTYSFSGWTPEITAVTGNAEYTAVFTDTINTYTVIWKNWDGTVLETDEDVEYGTTPEYSGEIPTKAGDAQYSYTFKDWSPAVDTVTGDITYTAVYEQTINQYTITWKDGDTVLSTEQVAYGETPVYAGETPTKAKDSQYSYTFKGWTPEIAAVTGEATYTAAYAKTGWVTDEKGTTYVAEDEVLYQEGIGVIDGEIYWFEGGYLAENKGLVRIEEDNDVKYYFFGANGKAARGTDDGLVKMWVGKDPTGKDLTNGLLPAWDYVFGTDGVIVHDAKLQNGIHRDGRGVLCYYIDGIKVHRGMFQIGNDYYYAKGTGELVVNAKYYCTDVNGLMPEGPYTFDENGKMVRPDTSKNGIVAENGSLYYYVNGKLNYAGLIKIDNYLYYVKTSGEVVHSTNYWITKTNGLMPEKSYAFADDGRMIGYDASKNGIVKEDDGSLYYYQNGAITYAGLIQIDGDYYYVKTSGEVIHGRDYWISKTNGLLPEKSYTFADDGKIVF